MSVFKFKNRFLELGNRTLVMGVHNATPDSFSDGGNYPGIAEGIAHCCKMIEAGADIIDIGGESTKPGDDSDISVNEELNRVLPIIIGVKNKYPDSVISIDTMKPEVARESVINGADIINDVSGLKYSTDIARVAAETKSGLILMHMKEEPKVKESDYKYDSLLYDIRNYLINAAITAEKLGVNNENIVLDPGLGGGCFGKNTDQNFQIIANIDFFKETGYPILAAPSKKSFIGDLLDKKNPEDRVWGTAAVIAWLAGLETDIVRVHDVDAMVQVVRIYEKIMKEVL